MATRIVGDTMGVLAFVKEHVKVPASEGMAGIGLLRDGQLIAGTLYEGFNGTTVWCHIAAIPGRRWMTREYLRHIFEYPFEQLCVESIMVWVESTNKDSLRFCTNLGFSEEAVLRGAGANGVDVHLLRMWRNECRFIRG